MSDFNNKLIIDLFEERDKLRAENEALNDRIKRLEEAGEKMVDEPLRKHRRWILNEAKEAKP